MCTKSAEINAIIWKIKGSLEWGKGSAVCSLNITSPKRV